MALSFPFFTALRRPTYEMSMISRGMNRFLSFVALAAVLPLLGLYGLLMYISTPAPGGGMEPTMTMVCYIALTIIFSALTIVVVNFSGQLRRQASGKFLTP